MKGHILLKNDYHTVIEVPSQLSIFHIVSRDINQSSLKSCDEKCNQGRRGKQRRAKANRMRPAAVPRLEIRRPVPGTGSGIRGVACAGVVRRAAPH